MYRRLLHLIISLIISFQSLEIKEAQSLGSQVSPRKMKVFMVVVIAILALLSPAWGAANLEFNLATATKATYSKFLTDLRNLVKHPTLDYGNTKIPVMRPPTNPPTYITIDLKGKTQGTIITIALNRNDLYVVGYLDKFATKFRAHFFPDAPDSAAKTLFPEAVGAANRLTIHYVSLYAKIEGAAGLNRRNLGLGVDTLNKWINEVYNKALHVPSEAKFFLIAIQMISEGARFKYIENQILDNFETYYNPDEKAIEFETSWEKTSKAVKSSVNGVINPPLLLKDEYGSLWNVTRVDQVKGDVGLFKNVENSSFEDDIPELNVM